MYHPLNKIPSGFPFPSFEVDVIPEGQTEAVIDHSIWNDILDIAVAGEHVIPKIQAEYGYNPGQPDRSRTLRWQTGEGNRATELGQHIDGYLSGLDDLATRDGPLLKVERVILRYEFIDKRQGSQQRLLYKFEGFDGEFSYRLFSPHHPGIMPAIGVVMPHKGELKFFPLTGPTEIGAQQADGNIHSVVIAPSRFGKLSFRLMAERLFADKGDHEFGYYDNPYAHYGETGVRSVGPVRMLANEIPFDAETFTPFMGTFLVREVDGGIVLDGLSGNNYNFISLDVALISVTRLTDFMDGYTDQRCMEFTKLVEKVIDNIDVQANEADALRQYEIAFDKIKAAMKADRTAHAVKAVSDFWPPAMKRIEQERRSKALDELAILDAPLIAEGK